MGPYTVGTYSFDEDSFSSMRWASVSNPSNYYTTLIGSGNGTINIIEISTTKLKGTFEFVAENQQGQTISITNEEFESNLE